MLKSFVIVFWFQINLYYGNSILILDHFLWDILDLNCKLHYKEFYYHWRWTYEVDTLETESINGAPLKSKYQRQRSDTSKFATASNGGVGVQEAWILNWMTSPCDVTRDVTSSVPQTISINHSMTWHNSAPSPRFPLPAPAVRRTLESACRPNSRLGRADVAGRQCALAMHCRQVKRQTDWVKLGRRSNEPEVRF